MVPDQEHECFRPSCPTQERRSTMKRSATSELQEESRIWRRRISSRDDDDDDGNNSVGSHCYYTSEKENEYLSGYSLALPDNNNEVCRPPLLRARSCTDPEEDYPVLEQEDIESRNDCDTMSEKKSDLILEEGQEVVLSPIINLRDVVSHSRSHQLDLGDDDDDDDDDLPPWMFANRANDLKHGIFINQDPMPIFLGDDSCSQESCLLLQTPLGSSSALFGMR